MRVDITRTLFFNELCSSEQNKYFKLNDKKFLHNVDSFYYSVFIKDDVKKNSSNDMICFLSKLLSMKDIVLDKNEPIYYFEDIQLKLVRGTFSLYNYCLSVENYFDIFIASCIPNDNTPRIVVQLRSIGLWTNGVKDLIYKSYDVVKRVLIEFNMIPLRTQENRIDFCYHTNSIQSMYKYFNTQKVKDNVRSNLEHYMIHGKKHFRELTLDYLCFGMRKSNNLFVRIYNKTQEVLQQGYKGFFIEEWYRKGLINFYDKFCYEYCYKRKSFKSLVLARIEFYLKYGTNKDFKDKLLMLKDDYSTNLDFISKYISGKLPEVTLITNIEYQVMRKFFYSSDSVINTLNHSSNVKELDRLFKILDNRKLFLDYLTSTSLCFVKSGFVERDSGFEHQYQSWWQRLRKVKLDFITDTRLIREYSRNLDFECLKVRLKGTIASMSLYIDCENDDSLHKDFSSVICSLNDNDMIRDDVQIVSLSTGEIINLDSENDFEYEKIKEKKKKSLKSLLKDSAQKTSKDS